MKQIEVAAANRERKTSDFCLPLLHVSKSLQMVTAAMKLKHLLLERKAMTNLDSILKNRDITFPTKVCQSKL